MSWKRILYPIFVVVVAAVSALAGTVTGGVAVYQAVRQNQAAEITSGFPPITLQPTGSPPQALVVNTTDIETAITQAVKRVGPAVVTVVATLPPQRTFFGYTGEQTVSGSGVFISNDGYILTNNHVVEGAVQVFIILSDGSQEAANLVGTDLYADLAVLKTEGAIPAYASLGNSDALDPGETVIAIGSPLGSFKNSVTVGVVSATGRSLDTGEGYQIEGLIQTDAAINQGNSGGPLVNLAGEVVGINTLVVRSSDSGTVAEGLGFAIPMNTAQAVAGQIIEQGFFSRPYLGIRWQPITPEIAARYRLPVEWGAYVTEVITNSPASQAGLQPGDIITRIGAIALDESHPYINTLFSHQPGEQVVLEVARGRNLLQVEVILGEVNAGG